MNPERYHLTLTSAGRPVVHGWWTDEAVARGKFTRWVGEYSGVDGARIILVDEVEQRQLAVWPHTGA